MKIRGAVLREFNKGYSIEELELDPPKQGEALVKYAFAGYCHSDLSNTTGFTPMGMPLVAGHEASGVVVDMGPGVTRVEAGRPRGQRLDVSLRRMSRMPEGHGQHLLGQHAALPERHHAGRHQPHPGQQG